jgi:hypothetical protein
MQTRLQECTRMLLAVGQSRATSFPPPLWGRDRERGGDSTPSVRFSHSQLMNNANNNKQCPCVFLPLSLSLPHKGGGNREARTFAPDTMCPWTNFKS